MSIPITFDPASNIALSGGESLVFHCHFYNCALQKAVEDGMGESAAGLLSDAAAGVVHRQLTAHFTSESTAARAELAMQTYAQLGFGTLSLDALSTGGGEAAVHASHYAMGWVAVHGERETPCCHFAVGFIQGALAAIHQRPLAAVLVRESACYACGADDCRFNVEIAS